jgi:ankyrin repeat protein
MVYVDIVVRLHWFVGRVQVKMLCELGADVHAKSSSGSTALHAAVMKHGSAGERAVCEVVHALVELGASVHVQDHLGRTPLHWAALSRNAEAVGVTANPSLCT